MPLLKLTDLRKSYQSPEGAQVPVVHVPLLEAEPGEQVALIGRSGSGKTTLLHLIAGILKPDSGSIQYAIDGNVTELVLLSEAARDHFRGEHLGYIFQKHHLLPGFSALENVQLGMSFTGRRADKKWARELLEAVGLADRLHYKPGKLSVGQQQRVAVARALANKPSLVLADEPTGSVDPATAASVMNLIRGLCHQVNAALLVVTHDRAISATFDRVIDLTPAEAAIGLR